MGDLKGSWGIMQREVRRGMGGWDVSRGEKRNN